MMCGLIGRSWLPYSSASTCAQHTSSAWVFGHLGTLQIGQMRNGTWLAYLQDTTLQHQLCEEVSCSVNDRRLLV